MRVFYWPYWKEEEKAEGSLDDFLSKLKLEKHADLWALARKTIEEAEKPKGLEILKANQRVGPLKGVKEPIWEFRIPPRKRGGVVRIYFCHKKEDHNCIICLDAELKKRAESSPQKIQSAKLRYREVVEWKNRGR